jgi:hypothetical protein
MKIFKYIFIIISYLSVNILTIDYIKSSSEFVVNQETKYYESDPFPLYLSDNNIIIAWLSYPDTQSCTPPYCQYFIYINKYDSNGKLIKAITANDTAFFKLSPPWAAIDLSGGFVVITQSYDSAISYSIRARKYDTNLNPGSYITLMSITGTPSPNSVPVIERLYNGSYIVVWSISYNNYCIWAQQFSYDLTPSGDMFSVPDTACDLADSISVTSLQNTVAYAIVWNSSLNPFKQVLAKVFFSDHTTTETIVSNAFPSNNTVSPSVTQLISGDIIVVWGYDRGEIYLQHLDNIGMLKNDSKPINWLSNVNSSSSCFVRALSWGGFVMIWNDSNIPSEIVIMIFDSTNVSIGHDRLVNTEVKSYKGSPKLAESKDSARIITVWHSKDQIAFYDVYAVFLDYSGNSPTGYPIPPCSDFTVYKGTNQAKINIPFYWVLTITAGTANGGQLIDNNGDAVSITSSTLFVYNGDHIFYQSPSTPVDDYFSYKIMDTTSTCKVSVKLCYVSCLTCTAVGDSTNHNCSQCDTNYYPLVDKNTNCYKSTDTLNNYTFDQSKGAFVTPSSSSTCYKSCSTCSSNGDDFHHNCIKCNTNYFPLEDNTSFCYMSTQIVTGYLFNSGGSVFKKCYFSCATCSAIGDSISNKCQYCALNYYPLLDDTTMCFKFDSQVGGYYFDNLNKVFKRCFKSCQSCLSYGDESNTNCIKCTNNYYPLVGNNLICVDPSTTRVGYVFSLQDKAFEKCYESCNTCSGPGNTTTNNCLTCSSNYYSQEDNTSNCYNKDTTIPGYYFDAISNIFKKCYTLCSTCSGPGDINTPNCIECAPGYSSCNGCTNYIYRDNCVDECPQLTYLNFTNKTCLECNQGEVVYNNQCYTECPNSLISDLFTCIDCKTNNMYKYNNQCVESCPKGLVASNGICTQYSYPTSTETCKVDTCANGGICSIKLNRISCSCNINYTGQYCQLKNNSEELSTYLSI